MNVLVSQFSIFHALVEPNSVLSFFHHSQGSQKQISCLHCCSLTRLLSQTWEGPPKQGDPIDSGGHNADVVGLQLLTFQIKECWDLQSGNFCEAACCPPCPTSLLQVNYTAFPLNRGSELGGRSCVFKNTICLDLDIDSCAFSVRYSQPLKKN